MGEFGSCFAKRFFRHVALSYVLHCTYVLGASVIVTSTMSDQVQELDRAITHDDPVLILKVFTSLGSCDHVGQRRHVVGMNSAGNKLKRYSRIRFEFENTIHRLGPKDLVGHYPPPKIAHARKMLAFCQKRLAAAQFFFAELSAGDVLNRREVFELPLVVTGGPSNRVHVSD